MAQDCPVHQIFGPDGILAVNLSGYEPRPDQEKMAAAVASVLEGPGEISFLEPDQAVCLVVEAETGLGKTLAYLAPAVLSGRKVVVSTNTRNLQDQILQREIPFIKKYIDPKLKALCVKGRQNYLCLYRWHQYQSAGQAALVDDKDVGRLDGWIAETDFADRAELRWLPGNSPLWRKICCLPHFCLGADCPDSAACFLNRLRREAAKSRLLVVNHHLLFSDLAVRRTGHGEVLPRYEAVIFDEAHHIENVASVFFGFSFSRYQVLDLAGDVERSARSGSGGHKHDEALAAARSLTGLLEQFLVRFPAEVGRFPLARLPNTQPGFGRMRDTLLSAFDRLAEAMDGLDNDGEPWDQYIHRCRELASRLKTITAETSGDIADEDIRFVHWYERREKNLVLSATPIDVADDLKEALFSTVGSAVLTSATLSVDGHFQYFRRRLGMPEDTKTLTFPSPFDYANRTLLYVPDMDFPEPAAPGYGKALHGRIEKLVRLSGGRALVLFTSIQAMDKAYHALRDALEFPLLLQGTGPRHELLSRFARERESVLFAVASFWEGVDIPGESLSLVIVDKLPFEVPSDPVIMARINRIRSAGGNPFFDFQVPRAVLALRQGVGRLIRRSSDRGVMAVLDVRLFTKGYGHLFIKSLPPSPLCRDLDQVKIFFTEGYDKNKTG